VGELFRAPWQAQIALATLFISLAVSVVTDLRQKLILNAVTFPALAVVLACFYWLGGVGLVLEALIGAAVCVVPLLIGYFARAMAPGDVKLMAVCGAVAGAASSWAFAATVLLFVSIAGGLQAALWLVGAKLLHRPRPRYIPYGVAIAAGTAYAFLFGGAFV
jgi:prepilin peptidase CpaA